MDDLEDEDPPPLEFKQVDLEAKYFEQAYEAYRANDFKQCLVLLKYVKSSGPHVVRLSVDCTYGFWKHNIMGLEDGPERQKNLDMVLASYTHMINISEPSEIPASEYIRISHIYLTEGSLQSAITILKLAQERGYLEDVTIVVQLHTVLKRLGGLEVEAENCMLFLMNAIFMEPRPKEYDEEEKQSLSLNKSGPLSVATSALVSTSPSSRKQFSSSSTSSTTNTLEKFAATMNAGRPGSPVWAPAIRKPATMFKFIGSELIMSFAYCHVAAYCRARMKHKHIYSNPNRLKKYAQALRALLAEAYYLATNLPPNNEDAIQTWFNDPSLWTRMGDSLASTPYILLAEDSYWESFLTDSTLEEGIDKLFKSMRLYRREHLIWDKLMEALLLAPFNLWLRKEVVKYEIMEAKRYNPAFEEFEKMRVFKEFMIVNKMTERGFSADDIKFFLKTKKPPPKGHFETRFERDVRILILCQACIRRFLMRKDFEVFKAKVLKRREMYRAVKREVDKKYLLSCNKLKRKLLHLWRKIAAYLKLFNFRAATIIQQQYRRHVCRKWLKWMRFKVQRANSMFPLASQVTYDFQKMRILREWNRLFWAKRRGDAVDKIVSTVRTFGVSKKFYITMEFLLQALKIHRRYSNKHVWIQFKAAYERRRRVHAKYTIRFWIRSRYKITEEAQIVAAIEAVDWDAKVQSMKTFGKYLKRKMLKIWVSELSRKRKHFARVKVAIALYYIFHKNRVANKILLRRKRRERAEKFVMKQKYLEKIRYFLPWKRNAFAQRIQRRARTWISKKKLKRLKVIAKGCYEMVKVRNGKSIKNTFWRFRKYVYLYYRHKCRASNLIKKCFRKVMLRRYLRNSLGRRHRVGVYSKLLGLMVYRYAFRKFQAGSKRLFTFVRLSNLFKMVRSYMLIHGLKEFKEACRRQVICTGLMRILVQKRLNFKFWIGSHHSVSLLYDSATKLRWKNLLKSVDVEEGVTFMYKETPVFMNRQLEDSENIPCYKAFKSWMAAFRNRYRVRAGGAPGLAKHFFNKILLKNLGNRRYSCIQIQRVARGYMDRIRVKPLFYRAKRAHERSIIVSCITTKNLFSRINKWAIRRLRARVIIQCFLRRCKAKVISEDVKAKIKFHKKCSDYISHSLTFNKRLLKKMLSAMQIHTCEKLVYAAFSYGKLIHQSKRMVPGTSQSRKNNSSIGSGIIKGGKLPLLLGGGEGGFGDNVGVHAASNMGKVKARNRVDMRKGVSISRDDSDDLSIGSGFLSQHSDVVSDIRTKTMITGEFQSQEFYSSINKLKQTGTFMVDVVKSQLNPVEMNYLVARAATLFIQGMHTAATSLVVNVFQGQKLVFCGGSLTHQDSSRLFQALLDRKEMKDLQVLHVMDVNCGVYGAMMLAQYISLASSPPNASNALTSLFSPISYSTKIRELYVDSRTFGTLGLPAVLVATRLSSSLKSLSLKCSDSRWPVVMAAALNYSPQGDKSSSSSMSSSSSSSSPPPDLMPSSLEELRLFGAPIDELMLTALVRAVGAAGHFSSLIELEFTIDSKNQRAVLLSERIIHISKDRVSRGKRGLSVRVNTIA